MTSDLILRSHAQRGVSEDGGIDGILAHPARFEKAAPQRGHAEIEGFQGAAALL
jgi:hypothetical protein